MRSSTSVLAIALSVLGLAQGLVVERAPVNEICYTTMGTKSVKDVLTSSHTVTSTATKTVVYHVESVATVVPAAVTLIATELSTKVEINAAGTETDTATVKTTVVGTVTKTVTVHPTVTKTSTKTTTVHSTKTSTVSTSSGFIPISSSLPGSKKAKRELIPSKPSRKQGKFAQAVDCKNIETFTTTVTSTTVDASTITAEALTAMKITTQIITSTVLAHPNAKAVVTSAASSTKTVTVTKTGSTSTKTVTKTKTTTDVSPGPTIYAGCAAINQMPTYQGHVIDGVTGDYDNELVVNATSLYSCCVACFESPTTCSVGYHDGDDPTDCWLVVNNGNVCNSQKSFGYEAFSCNYNGYGAFNGPCGTVNSFENFGDSCD